MGYTQNLSDISLSIKHAYSIAFGGLGDIYNSYSSYKLSGGFVYYSKVGDSAETDVGATYYLKSTPAPLPKGEINYYHTTVTADKLAKGTQLWN